MNDVISLFKRLDDFNGNVSKIENYVDFLQSQIRFHQDEIEKLKYTADLNQKSSEIFKVWLEDLLDSNVNSISELVTSGLRYIISDQKLTFRIKQELKYNRLSMRFIIEENDIEGDPMMSFGGGAVLVASLILRLAVMTRMRMGNLLLLDETMFALANQYVPSAADFMRQLSERTGINILMVTHNEEFMSNAHLAYEGIVNEKDGIKTLSLNSKQYGERS
jgi:DNA repair exonuclease SbcCD ATPase subunit